MIKRYLLLLLIISLAACSSFREEETTIKLENNSAVLFDSVVITSPLNHTVAKDIRPGAIMSTTFTLVGEAATKGSFNLSAYINGTAALSFSFGNFNRLSDVKEKYKLEITPDKNVRELK